MPPHLPDLIAITDKQFELFIKRAIATNYGRDALAKITTHSGERAAPQTAEAAAQGNTAPDAKLSHTAQESGSSKGIATERGNINREINDINKELRQVRARIRKAKDWLYTQPIENAPTMISIMSNIADSKNLNNRFRKIADLKTQAKILTFLQGNNITDMEQLTNKVVKMNEEFYEVSNKIKAADRRLETLAQHIAQYDNYKTHKAVYDKYKQLDPKKRDAFYDKHSEKIQLFENTGQYLTEVMNGKTGVPIKTWQAEQTKLTAERFSLCEGFYRLKDEVRSVEVLRKGAERLINENRQERQCERSQGAER